MIYWGEGEVNIDQVRYIAMSDLNPGRLFIRERDGKKMLGVSLTGSQSGCSVIFEDDPRRVRRHVNVTNAQVLELGCEWSFDAEKLSRISRFTALDHDSVPIIVDDKATYMPVEVDVNGRGAWQMEWLILSGGNRFELASGEIAPSFARACVLGEFSVQICLGDTKKKIDPFNVLSL
ncbi:hypothetical protein [Thalassospira sp. MIT1370]|uniref:hypothetical protein n=1 Tax=unclassified Thalassospira TaxID=2648997 RepID=UPI0039995DC0